MLLCFANLLMEKKQMSDEIIEFVNKKNYLKLIELFQPLIDKWIRKYSWSKIDKDDLQQECCIALIRAADNYDSCKGASFGTYLKFWLHYYIQQYVVKNLKLVRPCLSIGSYNSDYLSEVQKKAINDYHNFSYVNIDNDDSDYLLRDDSADYIQKICEKEILKIAKDELCEKHYKILLGRCNELSLTQLGKINSLSKERIRQIELKSIKKLQEKIGV